MTKFGRKTEIIYLVGVIKGYCWNFEFSLALHLGKSKMLVKLRDCRKFPRLIVEFVAVATKNLLPCVLSCLLKYSFT